MNDAWLFFWLVMLITTVGTITVWAYDRVERWWRE